MGIYRGGYRQYDGPMLPAATRFLIIAAGELQRFRNGRWTRRLVLLSMVPLVVTMVVLVTKALVENKAGPLPFQVDLLGKFMTAQVQFMALLGATAGAGLIAMDRQANALSLYLARPVSSLGYLGGKALALGGLFGLVYVAPGLVFVAVEFLVASRPEGLTTLLHLLQVLVAGVAHIAVMVGMVLLLSSMGKRTRYVGLVWVALFYLSGMLSEMAREATGGEDWASLISLPKLFTDSAGLVFERTENSLAAAGVLLGLGVVSWAALFWRLKRLRHAAVTA